MPADERLTIVPFLNKVNEVILNPLILLLFAIALIVFIWGVVQMIAGASSEEARDKGKSHIIWGLVGMVIMVSVYGIIALLLGTFGIDLPGYLG